MRIALVQPKFDGGGGAEDYARALATGLAARGEEVHLYGRRRGPLPPGAVFHRVPAFAPGRALKTYAFWRLSGRLVPAERFDVVQGSGKTTCQTVHRLGGGVHRAYLSRLGRRGRTLYDRVVLGIEDRLFASPSLAVVVCPSPWVAGEAARWYPGIGGKTVVVPNGVDTARFTPEGTAADRRRLRDALALDGDAPVVLFAATNFRLKGLDRAIEALPLIPGATLAAAGGGDAAPFREQAASLGVAGRVAFPGRSSRIEELYRGADLLLHPTRYDPFANVCLQALACGTPVVATSPSGMEAVLEKGRGGRVLPRDASPEELAAAAGELLGGGAAARAAARETALAFGQERHLDRMLDIYRRVTETAGGRGK